MPTRNTPPNNMPTLRITSTAIGPNHIYQGPSLEGYAGHVEIDADLGRIIIPSIRVKGHIRALSGSGIETTEGGIEAADYIEAGAPGLVSAVDIKSGGALYTRGTATARRDLDVEGDLTVGEQVRANSVKAGGSVDGSMILLDDDFTCEGDVQLKRDIIVGGSITTKGRMVCGGQILATRNISASEIISEGAITTTEGEIEAPGGIFSRNDVLAQGSILLKNGQLQARSAHSIKGSILCREQINTQLDLQAFADIVSDAGIAAGWNIIAGGAVRSGLAAFRSGIESGLSVEAGSIESQTGLNAGTSVRSRSTIRVKGRIMAGLLLSRPLTREEMEIQGNILEGMVVIGLLTPNLSTPHAEPATPRRPSP